MRSWKWAFSSLPAGGLPRKEFLMSRRIPWIFLLSLVSCIFAVQPSALADNFGTSGNEFTIDFVPIGNAGNAADTTGYGAVTYSYRMGKYEIFQEAITKATASGMSNVTAGAWMGSQPAADVSWYEAAAFVNWLNISTGKTAAYNLTFTTNWSMILWNSEEAWTAGGENLYRNKNAYYFLPSENEWYKAAYYNPAGSDYFPYPTGSSTAPLPVTSGTQLNSAVYRQPTNQSLPAEVIAAGGLSPYATMGQGGNIWEWTETALSGDNNSATNVRTIRGGGWTSLEGQLSSSFRSTNGLPDGDRPWVGFRVASIPEPSTYALLLVTGAGALWWAAKKARFGRGVRRKIP